MKPYEFATKVEQISRKVRNQVKTGDNHKISSIHKKKVRVAVKDFCINNNINPETVYKILWI